MNRPLLARVGSSAIMLLCGMLLSCQQGGQHDAATTAYDDSTVTTLLNKAHIAFDKGQLTSPEKDNALYFYQKVLVLRPNQPDALSGREAIFDRYLAMARDAEAKHNYPQAIAMVDKAETVLLPSRASKALRQQILDEQKQFASRKVETRPATESLGKATGIEYLLSMKGLTDKDDKILERLRLIAEHVQELKDTVIIEARSDAEGRWILQQLKTAVPNYHLRSDIRISQYPKIILLQSE